MTGGAGQGVHTAGGLLCRLAVAAGHHFHATQDYLSRIRGGRNSYSVRIREIPVRAGRHQADIALSLDPSLLPHILSALAPAGIVVCDLPAGGAGSGDARVTAAPLKDLAIAAGSPILANIVGAGIVARMLGIPPETVDRVLIRQFQDGFLEKNRVAARLGSEWADPRVPSGYRLPEGIFHPRMVLGGNEALALGAVAGGCKFAAGYPMTPGSGILHGLSEDGPPLGLVFEQAEDEIAALNMAIGASYAGARAMVATSGGGFALMVEALSLAGMMESPVVVALAMRPGPATGMPTRTGQVDLAFALSAGHGEFPRLVLSPGSVEEAYALAHHAMEMAEAYQVPCILLTDQYLADTVVDADPGDFPVFRVNRRIVRGNDVPRDAKGRYLRYAFTGDGVSPMAVPGVRIVAGMGGADSDRDSLPAGGSPFLRGDPPRGGRPAAACARDAARCRTRPAPQAAPRASVDARDRPCGQAKEFPDPLSRSTSGGRVSGRLVLRRRWPCGPLPPGTSPDSSGRAGARRSRCPRWRRR